mgnify:CR=1 FL=1
MKNLIHPFVILVLFISATAFAQLQVQAQDCEPYFPAKTGTIIEMTNFKPDGKAESRSVSEIIEKTDIPGGMAMKVKGTFYDKKDKKVMENTYEVKCENGIFYMDMRNFMPAENNQMFGDMDASVETNYLEFPSNLQVGQTLPDGSLTLAMNSNGMALFNMNINITNRKVEALETITTAAGTFECFKISQQTDIKMLMNISTKSVTWYAKNVGAVRTESYNKNGKLTGYTEITSVKE